MGQNNSSFDNIIPDSEVNENKLMTYEKLFSLPSCGYSLSRYSVVDKESAEVKQMLQSLALATETKQFPINGDVKFDKCLASIFGNVIGDSLGCPTEFSNVRYNSTEVKGFDLAVWTHPKYNHFGLKPGQWTDDASMMNCLAESLIACNGFNPIDLRVRFSAWVYFGYCNAFGYNEVPRSSVGLGGNISLSINEFDQECSEYTKMGDKNTSGNGSIMRNAPIAIYFAKSGDLAEAEKIARLQSLTTHQGDEAAECCRLLTHICMKAFEGGDKTTVLTNLPQTFKSDIYSITCLVNAMQEEKHENNKDHHLKDRNWNWKHENHRYSPTRSVKQPGYIGSYAMDNLCMSLHCIWTTDSFTESLLKCVNMRGDSDSVAAVVGQMAGAFYGFSSIPADWLTTVLQWDPYGLIPYRAKLLYENGYQKK
jgi:ADP-ribosylglycohydrolase